MRQYGSASAWAAADHAEFESSGEFENLGVVGERPGAGGCGVGDERVGSHGEAAYGFDLAGDDVVGNLVKALDSQGVLHGHRGDRDARVYTEQRHGAHVGLDARAAPGVRSGDGHHPRRCLARWR